MASFAERVENSSGCPQVKVALFLPCQRWWFWAEVL